VITNAMAVIHLLNSVVDVYLFFMDKIDDLELAGRIKERKQARTRFIAAETERIKLEVLRDLERNSKP
jgi:hypothetical protein